MDIFFFSFDESEYLDTVSFLFKLFFYFFLIFLTLEGVSE